MTGALLLNVRAIELALPAEACTTPQADMFVEQIVTADEPLDLPVESVSTEPLRLACMMFEFVLFTSEYEPLPPLTVIWRFCPETTVTEF